MTMSCERAAELLSDDLEGTLEPILAAELRGHLALCAECRELRAAVADVSLFLRAPAVEPAADLAQRVARASFLAARPRAVLAQRRREWAGIAAHWINWLGDVPFAVQAAAAVFALVMTAGLVTAAGSAPGTAGHPRIAQRLSDATVYVVETKERLVEDFRLLRVVIATAFEGRLDRVNDRVDDYRRLLERRRQDEQAKGGKGGSKGSRLQERSEPAPDGPRRTV